MVTIRPDDPAGILDIMPVHISPDGHTYAYGYRAAVAEPAPNHNFAKNLSLVERIEEIAKAKGCTPSQLGLAWVLAQGEDIVPIPGTK